MLQIFEKPAEKFPSIVVVFFIKDSERSPCLRKLPLPVRRMKYYEKYRGKGKEVVLVGIGFYPEKRNIGDYLQESP